MDDRIRLTIITAPCSCDDPSLQGYRPKSPLELRPFQVDEGARVPEGWEIIPAGDWFHHKDNDQRAFVMSDPAEVEVCITSSDLSGHLSGWEKDSWREGEWYVMYRELEPAAAVS